MQDHGPHPAFSLRLPRRACLLIGIASLAGCAGEDSVDDGGSDETTPNGDDTTDDEDTADTATNGDDSTDGVDPSEDAILAVVDTFWDALVTGDRETAEDVVGSSSPLREVSWWDDPWEDLTEQGIEVAVIDREIVNASDGRYVVTQRSEWDVPGERPGIATDEFTLQLEDESVVVWEFTEVEWEEIAEDEPTRFIRLDIADELAGDLAFEPAVRVAEDSLVEIDGVPTLVLDPGGEPLYNAAARTRFDAFLDITNEGEISIDRLVATLSVTGTANDVAHEAAIGLIRAGEVVPLDGEANLLDQPLEPGETATIGLELDLMDSGISDIEPGADMEIAIRRD